MILKADLRLSLSRPGGERLNFHFKLEVSEPGVTAIVGPSGIGKSTFLRCLAGLTRASGRVELKGRLWQDENFFLPTYRRPLGYVFQQANLFDHLTLRRNLEYALKRGPRRGGVQRPDLAEFIQRLGLEPLMEQKPSTLSGGEAQRAALARALASAPELLLLDEPLAALDEERKEEILPYLEKLRDLEMPIIYVTHDRRELKRLAGRVLHLERSSVSEGPELHPGSQGQDTITAFVAEGSSPEHRA